MHCSRFLALTPVVLSLAGCSGSDPGQSRAASGSAAKGAVATDAIGPTGPLADFGPTADARVSEGPSAAVVGEVGAAPGAATLGGDSIAELSGASDTVMGVTYSDESAEGNGIPASAFQAGSLTAGAWDDNINFERFLEYRGDIFDQQLPGLLPFDESDHLASNERFAEGKARETLDVALVIDTTGSMGDELDYLKTEFEAIAESILDTHPGADQNWALVTYKDAGDRYETRIVDFTSDLQQFRAALASERADGGGDYPEASHAALREMAGLQWRTGENTARLAFWVGDAPHHAGAAAELASAVTAAVKTDVHVYPVASSGVDDLTEITMRSTAQLTGGRYLFLTDDSGFGNAHAEPTIPCYFVTRLDQAILRMVSIEMSGTYREPKASEVIRTSGAPGADGVCDLEGQTMHVF